MPPSFCFRAQAQVYDSLLQSSLFASELTLPLSKASQSKQVPPLFSYEPPLLSSFTPRDPFTFTLFPASPAVLSTLFPPFLFSI